MLVARGAWVVTRETIKHSGLCNAGKMPRGLPYVQHLVVLFGCLCMQARASVYVSLCAYACVCMMYLCKQVCTCERTQTGQLPCMYICLSACLSVFFLCLSAGLSDDLFVYLPVRLLACLTACLHKDDVLLSTCADTSSVGNVGPVRSFTAHRGPSQPSAVLHGRTRSFTAERGSSRMICVYIQDGSTVHETLLGNKTGHRISQDI